jgi:5-methylcytosine-specific restriction endonuclease McrA
MRYRRSWQAMLNHQVKMLKRPKHGQKYQMLVLFSRTQQRKKTKPAVIFEVGFSEGYEDLLFDKDQWITKNKWVQLVILIDMKEAKKVRQECWKTTACQRRIRNLVKIYANPECRYDKEVDDDGTSSTNSVVSTDSDPSMYEEIAQAIDVNDCVHAKGGVWISVGFG